VAGSVLAEDNSVTAKFELGDSLLPELPGSGDVLSVSGVAGPDWEELFNADRSLRDLVGADGQPPANGVPDFVDLYQGHAAVFVGDDVSAGTAVDLTVRFGDDRLETGPVSSVHDLGNAYVYTTSSDNGDSLLFVGLERLSNQASEIEFEFNQGLFRLGHGFPGVSGWEIVGVRAENDARITLTFAEDGLLGSLAVDNWEDPESDGSFSWVRKAVLYEEGCNDANPDANPPIDAQSLCVFRNATVVPSGGWPSYDGLGQVRTDLEADCFYEFGMNITHLLGPAGQGPDYTTVRVRTPVDLAFAYFSEGN
jgi:hypothetical protein